MDAPRNCKDANRGQTTIKKLQEHITALVRKKKNHNEDSDFLFSSTEEEVPKIKMLQPAREYKVTQINGNSRAMGLDLVTLLI